MTARETKREAIKQMFGGRCAYCGCELVAKWHCDHVEPIYRGWTRGFLRFPERDTRENMFPACVPCNLMKNVLSMEEFRQVVIDRIVALRKWSADFRHAERFGRVAITREPLVFWFERYAVETVAEAPQQEKMK